eukprot:2655021-Pyramimonas_sp.AAC.1
MQTCVPSPPPGRFPTHGILGRQDALTLVAEHYESKWKLAGAMKGWVEDTGKSLRNMLRHANQAICKTVVGR